jgi:hypothetical protein
MSDPDPEDGTETSDAPPDAGNESAAAGDDSEAVPLEGLAREVRERRDRRERRDTDAETLDIDDDVDDLFESVDVAEVDSDSVWATFAEGGTGGEGRTELGLGAEVEAVEAETGTERGATGPADTDHVVPKTEFCQQCPHFTDPPETACTHEGTTIVEVVDGDHFRVRDCPIVAEQRDDEFATPE